MGEQFKTTIITSQRNYTRSRHEYLRNSGNDIWRLEKMLSEFDILIAAIVQHCRETIITRDKHFQEITTINIRQW